MVGYSRKGMDYFRYKNKRFRKTGKVLKFFFVLFVLYWFFSVFIITGYSVKTTGMEPGITKGQKLLATPLVYGPRIPITGKIVSGFRLPKRGDVVIVLPPNRILYPWYITAMDTIVRTLTLQNYSILSHTSNTIDNQVSLKRIIALPGDTIKMNNFRAFIKPAGSSEFISEKDLIPKKYEIKGQLDILPLPEGWSKKDPYSGSFPALILKDNEYYVLNDNRIDRNDSRFFGTISRNNISSLVFLSYLPGLTLQ